MNKCDYDLNSIKPALCKEKASIIYIIQQNKIWDNHQSDQTAQAHELKIKIKL